MKVMAVNGSPRKTKNTATLLEHALSGARDAGADTELVHLYDLTYQGCVSCFACKRLGGKSYGRCATKDGLTEVLERASAADALILGSPLYFAAETGEMRSFMERLLFPFLSYTPGYASLFPGKIRVGLVYTMNVPEPQIPLFGMDRTIAGSQGMLGHVFGSCEVLLCTDTYQFDDYAKYETSGLDRDAKAKRRQEVFPQDCRRAYDLGAKLAAAGMS